MKIPGLVGSTRKEGRSGVHTLVTTVLDNTVLAHELVHRQTDIRLHRLPGVHQGQHLQGTG